MLPLKRGDAVFVRKLGRSKVYRGFFARRGKGETVYVSSKRGAPGGAGWWCLWSEVSMSVPPGCFVASPDGEESLKEEMDPLKAKGRTEGIFGKSR